MGENSTVPQSSPVQFGTKCLRILNIMGNQITINLKQANVETRPVNSNGLGCSALIPLILIIYTCIDDVPQLYQITMCISVAFLFYSILFVLFLSTSCVVLKETVFGGCMASCLLSTLLMYVFFKQGFFFSLSISLLSTFVYSMLLRMSLVKCQKTFTIGEAMVVCQMVTLFTVMSVIKFFFVMEVTDDEMDFISTIIYVVLLAATLAILTLYLLSDAYRTIMSLSYIVCLAAAFIVLMLHHILGPYCFIKMFHYIFVERNRWTLISFWLVLVVLAVIALMFRTKLAVKADTVTRKTFHLLASVVFLSGILFDIHLITLAAGIGMGVIAFVEALRKSAIEPVSSVLESVFLVYSDEKDSGVLAMSPLYLYAGLACPLVLVPGREQLELLSGVLATGVGDTAASWFGSRYGYYKWPGSARTMEGTVFNILSQVGTVYALQIFKLIDVNQALIRTAIAATASGLVEASTEQVDNLILPLVTIIAYQLTRSMS